jgi:hypothetical protein
LPAAHSEPISSLDRNRDSSILAQFSFLMVGTIVSRAKTHAIDFTTDPPHDVPQLEMVSSTSPDHSERTPHFPGRIDL